MRVGIKYCGGCDPTYERVDYVRQLQRAAGDRIEWFRFDEEGLEGLLLVHGCDSECIETTPWIDISLPLISIRNDTKPPDEIVTIILKKGGKS